MGFNSEFKGLMLLLSEGQAGEAWEPSEHSTGLSDIGGIELKNTCTFLWCEI